MKRRFAIWSLISFFALPLQCATLERLSMADMISKSTAIVRATVGTSSVARNGPVIYTHYRLQVIERYKGAAASTVDLALPGGAYAGFEQTYSGVPQLHAGEEYVFFLYTGSSGLTQIIGLTQGLFAVAENGAKDPALTRVATHETMLDRTTGRAVRDETLTMGLSALKSKIAAGLGVKGGR